MNEPQPWLNEPDQWKGEHLGFPVFILRHEESGHLCGYAGVGPTHPLHGVDYNDPHPSLKVLYEGERSSKPGVVEMVLASCKDTDAERYTPDLVFSVHGGITYTKDRAPYQEPDGNWWFGFDCAHAGDLCPNREWRTFETDDVYRTFEYVQDKVRHLAYQLAEVQDYHTKQTKMATEEILYPAVKESEK